MMQQSIMHRMSQRHIVVVASRHRREFRLRILHMIEKGPLQVGNAVSGAALFVIQKKLVDHGRFS